MSDLSTLDEQIEAMAGAAMKRIRARGFDPVYIKGTLESVMEDRERLQAALIVAEKLIEALHGAVNCMTGGSTMRVYGNTYLSESGDKRRSVALTNEARKKLAEALALWRDYQKGTDTTGEDDE